MTAMIVEAAARSLVFALAVGVGLRALRVSNVPVRKAAWSLVLVASLAMPFLMRWTNSASWAGRFGYALAWPAQSAVLERPAPAQTMPRVIPASKILTSDPAKDVVPAATRVKRTPTVVASAPEMIGVDITPAVASSPVPARRQLHLPPAMTLVVWIYLAVSGLLLLRLLWSLGMAVRIWATAELVSPLVAPEPNVRASAKIPSPVTIGSGIVLPADYLEWDRSKLRMVLAHERSHVRQLDFYLQLLAGLYTALVWFSPLGWWLRRTLQTLGEAIGDRAGLDVAASRSRYAELLLEFAAMPRQALRRT